MQFCLTILEEIHFWSFLTFFFCFLGHCIFIVYSALQCFGLHVSSGVLSAQECTEVHWSAQECIHCSISLFCSSQECRLVHGSAQECRGAQGTQVSVQCMQSHSPTHAISSSQVPAEQQRCTLSFSNPASTSSS